MFGLWSIVNILSCLSLYKYFNNWKNIHLMTILKKVNITNLKSKKIFISSKLINRIMVSIPKNYRTLNGPKLRFRKIPCTSSSNPTSDGFSSIPGSAFNYASKSSIKAFSDSTHHYKQLLGNETKNSIKSSWMSQGRFPEVKCQ